MQDPSTNEEIRAAFMALDKDKSGALDKKEMEAFAKAAYKIAKTGVAFTRTACLSLSEELTDQTASDFISSLWDDIDTDKSSPTFECYFLTSRWNCFLLRVRDLPHQSQ